ncbi:hypothetical protein EW145_g1157 [Phellinidium pouzarii]|uniref:FHA domain-containing protein n=1 Tax=Phellinidium pouzarii TaxID=167371 RepID=A0A4S4LG84_9AGAM|nr:hypothetical protein EW145_g1157 [Phellinidium pouzarii]
MLSILRRYADNNKSFANAKRLSRQIGWVVVAPQVSFVLIVPVPDPSSSPSITMPAPTVTFPPNHTPPFPALYLYPLNDSFVPKHISLVGNQRVKIGRQTNVKTVPGERNGYFDSKVLSRQHAEVWEENGKIFIKDVKSSNGTFINGDRLSAEGVESEPYELKTDDIVEFGIDIVGEDNKTIIHHKVAARVTCIFNVEDALTAQRDAYNFQQQQQSQQVAAGAAGTLNGAAHKRPMLQPQQNVSNVMGGMGGGARQPGKSTLTFEHILRRLSGELQKSRETSAELGAVAGAMGEIENVIGGGQPPNLPPYPHSLPAIRPPQPQNLQQQQQSQQQQSQQHQHSLDSEPSSSALHVLQSQLAETQASLSSHVEKIRTLETILSDHENIKRDVSALRELIEEQRDRQRLSSQRSREEDDDDDDDGQSIHTIVPHELESVPEEDETELEESEEERSARREELGRPRTPEPSSLGMHEDDYVGEHTRMAPSQPPGIPDEMTRRLSFLSDQLESALELSRSLQVQHAAAQQTIETLEGKVNVLESMVKATQSSQVVEGVKHAEEAVVREKAQQDSMVSLLAEFRKTIEDRWDSVKNDWEAERERMEKARGEWENRVKVLEDGVASASGKFELGIASLTTQLTNIKTNGLIMPSKHTGGLVTPPSPRSLSDVDSDSEQPLNDGVKGRKRSRSLGSRGHRGRSGKASRSRSPATSASATLVDGMSAPGTESSVTSLHSRRSSTDSPGTDPRSVEAVAAALGLEMTKFSRFPPTPESSIHSELSRAPAEEAQHGQV